MAKRPNSMRHEAGSISHADARKAVLGVQRSRSSAAGKTYSDLKSLAPSVVERYLGHFGVGSSPADAKRGSAIKKRRVAKKGSSTKKVAGIKKPTARKASPTRAFRRAG